MIKPIITTILFILAIASGIVVTKTGRPLNTAFFTVHKLLALAFIVFAILSLKMFSADLKMLIIVLSASLLFLMLATGGVLSFDKLAFSAVRISHAILPVITAILAIILFCIIKSK